MNKIVIDLEFTKIKDSEIRKICKEEIIQIGAVKLNNKNELVSRFNAYIKPTHTVISKKVEDLTHISNEMVENCVEFKEAFCDFVNWIGEEKYAIISWSDTDERVLKEEIALEEVTGKEIENMFESWIDAQAMVSQLIGISQSLSLGTTLKAIDTEFDGQEHSALDDAENTAKIVSLLDNEDAFLEAMGPMKELFTAKEDLTFNMGSLFGNIALSA